MHHPTDRLAYTTAFVIPVVEHKLEQDIILSYGIVHIKDPLLLIGQSGP